MQDKKSFGKYIAEKRKEANLTQEELANKLYVIPTTISKWERGVTYPDITVVANLCKELNISEHEFFTACDDEVLNKERMEIKKYKAIKKWIFYILNTSYLIGLITCFVCNLAIDHKISWFLIVLFGIAIAFTITSVPLILKSNKYKWFKVSIIFTLLVYSLLFVINYVNKGDWLLEGLIIATFVFMLLWIDVIICTFTNIDKYYKVSISLILLAILTAFTNPFIENILNISNDSDNIYNVIIALVMVIISLVISVKKILQKINTNI